MPILLTAALVLVVHGLDLHGQLLHLVQPGVVHPLLQGILLNQFLDVEAGPLQVDLEGIDFPPQVEDGVLVDLYLDPG